MWCTDARAKERGGLGLFDLLGDTNRTVEPSDLTERERVTGKVHTHKKDETTLQSLQHLKGGVVGYDKSVP